MSAAVRPRLAIIVPMLNEAAALPGLIAHLQPFVARGADLRLVDAGSDDGSAALARALGATVIDSARGRAVQMNAGAAATTADALLFLHADTRLPDDADRLVLDALARHDWGRFDVRIAGRARMLPVIAWFMNRRSRLSGIATGDQAIFIRRSRFVAIGGYPVQPLMEDIELSARLKRAGQRPACLSARVTTSGRRWEQRGVWPTIFLMWRLRLAYWRGASAETCAARYR